MRFEGHFQAPPAGLNRTVRSGVTSKPWPLEFRSVLKLSFGHTWSRQSGSALRTWNPPPVVSLLIDYPPLPRFLAGDCVSHTCRTGFLLVWILLVVVPLSNLRRACQACQAGSYEAFRNGSSSLMIGSAPWLTEPAGSEVGLGSRTVGLRPGLKRS